MLTLVPVILAGGEGKRLAPLSSPTTPKQFLRLGKGGESLFAAAYKRSLMVAPSQHILVITRKSMARQTWRGIREVDRTSKSSVILEPYGKNTAAAITTAAIYALNNFENPVLWVMPSDHYIEKPFTLINAVQESINAAAEGKIVTFGIPPHRSDSNYGHIIPGTPLKGHHDLHKVKLFAEKPKGEKLEWLMQHENCLWNSGMFMFSAQTILKHCKARGKLVVDSVTRSYKAGTPSPFGLILDSKSYAGTPSISIDHLVMEQNDNLLVRPVDIGWSDVGTWQSLWELSQRKVLDGLPLDKFLSHIQNVA